MYLFDQQSQQAVHWVSNDCISLQKQVPFEFQVTQ